MNKKNKKIENLIFDFDGTICDTLDFAVDEIYKLNKTFKTNYSKSEIKETIHQKSFISLVKEFKINKIFLIYLIWKIQRRLGKQIPEFKTFPHIKSTIKELSKEYNLYIISANKKSNVKKFLQNHNLELYFLKVKGRANPFDKSKAINKFCKKNNLIKNKTIYIGDELSDIKACRKSHLKIINVTYGFNSKKLLDTLKPKYQTNSPQEIYTLIKKIETMFK